MKTQELLQVEALLKEKHPNAEPGSWDLLVTRAYVETQGEVYEALTLTGALNLWKSNTEDTGPVSVGTISGYNPGTEQEALEWWRNEIKIRIP